MHYGPNDSNGDNNAFGARANDHQYEDDYPLGTYKSEHEAKRVLATEMMVRQIPCQTITNCSNTRHFYKCKKASEVTEGKRKKNKAVWKLWETTK